MGAALYIALKGRKKMDGHGSAEGRFYFSPSVVWEFSGFGAGRWGHC